MVDLAAHEHEVEGGARAARPRVVLRHEGAEAAGADPDVDVRRTRLVRRRLVALEPVAAGAASGPDVLASAKVARAPSATRTRIIAEDRTCPRGCRDNGGDRSAEVDDRL